MIRGARLLLVVALVGATAAAAAPEKKPKPKPECDGILNHPGCRNKQRIPLFRVAAAPLKRGFIDDKGGDPTVTDPPLARYSS